MESIGRMGFLLSCFSSTAFKTHRLEYHLSRAQSTHYLPEVFPVEDWMIYSAEAHTKGPLYCTYYLAEVFPAAD